MNVDLRVVSRHLGLLLFVLSAFILAVSVFAGFDKASIADHQHADFRALITAALIGVVAGGLLYYAGRTVKAFLGQREAILLVALTWLIGAALAALPFYFWAGYRSDAATDTHAFDSYVDCYFEAMSGLTTTGATILTSISTLPRSLLLWRAITHWLGGLGIVVLFVAVLPLLGVGARRVFRMEAPGPSPEGVKPRIQNTARTLWLIYLALTAAEILALMACGVDLFNAVCHTLATLATGGFSTMDESVLGFKSTAIHVVFIVFMLMAGINFGLYEQIVRGNWRSVRKDPELRTYLAIIAIATVIISIGLIRNGSAGDGGGGMPAGLAVRDGLFTVVAIQTTTGFCSADFDTWGFASKAILLVLMFVGGCAGSTGGGIKVVRIMVAVKVLFAEIEHAYRPKVVRTVKIGKATIDDDLQRSTLAYILGIIVLFVLGTVAIMLCEQRQGIDITTAATASIASLNNIGPGLARVGATENYAWFTDQAKLVICGLMVLGRLELFAIVVLFSPRYWRSE